MTPWARRLLPAAALLVCCAPLFVLTLRGWSNAVLFAGAILAALLLWRGGLPGTALGQPERGYARAMIIALVAPFAAVALSACLRGDPHPAQFDAPSRFLLAVPIFLFMLRARIDVGRYLQWVLPLALLLALGSLEVIGRSGRWPEGRDTTSVVDPLVFGYTSLGFALMCLMSVTPRQWAAGQRWGLLARVAGIVLGFYLSLRSGSRTGWFAVPLVLGVWLYLHWGRTHRWSSLMVLAAACAAPVAAYLLIPTVHGRVHEAWQEIAQYAWTGVAPYTSIGLRITYLRIAADVFALHPWAGVGETTRIPLVAMPHFSYASPEAMAAAFTSAFHNQVVSNAVRYGVAGLLSTVALLLVPLMVCTRQLWRASEAARENAAIGFAYMLCLVVSSMSTEVVDLKAMASLYAVMAAVLCAAALAPHDPRHAARISKLSGDATAQ